MGIDDIKKDIKGKLLNLVSNKKNLVIMGVVLIFILICGYAYKVYVLPKLEPKFVANKEFVPKDSQDEAVIMFFYTDWCPHCKKAKPVWGKIKEDYDQKVINNTKLTFKEFDCDKQEEIANKYNIEGYPTIKLQRGNKIIEYDAKPEESALIKFIETSL